MQQLLSRLYFPAWLALLWAALLLPPVLRAQSVELANRLVADIKIEGLKQVPLQLVLNQIRVQKGDPYNAGLVQEDVVRITHLGRFGSVTARVEPRSDGAVVLTYVVGELALLSDVQVVGNKALSDQELLKLAELRAGDPLDPFLIERAVREMKKAYEKEGYFEADISPDQEPLKESNILILRVREGPLAKIRAIRFEGNTVYSADQLLSKIKSRSYLFILRKGEVNREQLEQDAARLRDFYRDNGYLDAQVGRRIEVSPDQKDAVVIFVISEGKQFTVDQIQVQGNKLFSEAQILQAMVLKPGDVFAADRLKKTQEGLVDLYGKLGFIETRIDIERLFHEHAPKVDLLVKIDEGKTYTVGRVTMSGNQTTQDKVVEREVRGMRPGRRFDRDGIKTTEQRLRESPFFSNANVTILGDPADDVRDVLVETKEKQTGSLSFGAGISSDAGVIGAIDLTQRNFDIADVPDSAGEFFTGKAFRGAGQFFSLDLQPGNQFSRYSTTFREPSLLESDYFLDASAFFFDRDRTVYKEQRAGANVGIGERFGDIWQATVRGRGEVIDIGSIDPSAPVDVFNVQGQSTLTGLSFILERNTTDSRIFPTKGSVLSGGVERVGALGGNYNFTRGTVEFRKFFTVDEDFFGYKTIVVARAEAGYIFEQNKAPVFERFYAGGQRSFRGFKYRGAGPVGYNTSGLLTDQPVGGQWLFLTGLEYNFPIYEDIVRVALFTDQGTVQKTIGLNQYRVAIGAGLRLKIPFLGQAPFALDFAIPVFKQAGDQTQVFSFDLALPF